MHLTFGEELTIIGFSSMGNASIIILSPTNSTVFSFIQETPGGFTTKVKADWNESGEYEVIVSSGNLSNSTSFYYSVNLTSSELPASQSAEIELSEFSSVIQAGKKLKFQLSTKSSPNIKVKAFLQDPEERLLEILPQRYGEKYHLEFDFGRSIRPGIYKLKIRALGPNEEVLGEVEENLSVGIITVNTRKNIYKPGEVAEILIGVLDSKGAVVGDANITLTIVSPSGEKAILTTPESVKRKSDGTFFAYYLVEEVGKYFVNAIAITDEMIAEYNTSFEAREFVEFEISRDIPLLPEAGEEVTAKLEINSYVEDETFTVTEVLPPDFIVLDAGGGIIRRTQENLTITWNLTSKAVNLSYTFQTPMFVPRIYHLGEILINSGNLTFWEGRYYSIIVADAFWMMYTWYFYYNDTSISYIPIDPMVLCAGHNYTIHYTALETAADEDPDTLTLYLQVMPEGDGSYTTIPNTGYYKGFGLWGGDVNARNIGGEVGGNASITTCALNTDDRCYWDKWKLSLSPEASGIAKLRMYIAQAPAAGYKGTHIHVVRVINCSNIDLARDIKVFTHEKDKAVAGSLLTVVVPLANYNLTTALTANLTLEIFDELGNKYDWFIIEGPSQNVFIGASQNPGEWQTNITKWHIIVPDQVDAARTYIAKVSIHNSNGDTKIYEKKFTFYGIESQPLPIVLYRAMPIMIGVEDAAPPAGSEFPVAITVCNYGDFNVTVNVSVLMTLHSAVYQTTPPANLNGSQTSWWDVALPTGKCQKLQVIYRGSNDAGVETVTTLVTWLDPGSGKVISLEESVDVPTVPRADAEAGTAHPYLNVTNILPDSSIGVALTIKNHDNNVSRNADWQAYFPPGFNVSNFNITLAPGYPFGSLDEGYIVRRSVWHAGGWTVTLAAEGSVTYSFTLSSGNVSYKDFVPGGKPIALTFLGYGSYTKTYHYHTDKLAIELLGPWLKTIRYYNITQADEQRGFPTTFGCGNFTAKLEVFNKGNLPASNFNITENKFNVSVTHPGDLQFSNFQPQPSYYDNQLVSWSGVNFDVTGKASSQNFSYLISVPYQTNGTFTFFARHLNGTFIFYDRNYTIFVACGASLVVSAPLISPPSPLVGQSFNVSSILSNFGPGTASDVIAIINYTGPGSLQLRNASGMNSDINYLGNIPLEGSAEAKWEVIANVAGTYTICIRANATENSTEVINCTEVLVSLPPAVIEMENVTIVSHETGTSTGSWGFNFTFNISVRVSNSESDVYVCSWFSKTGSGPWKPVGECQVYPAPGQSIGEWLNFSFEFDPSCEDISPIVFVKFNATNNAGTTNSTTATFTITKDTIFFEEVIGNDTETRRGRTTTLLGVRVRDANGTFIHNLPVTFFVTIDGNIYDTGTTNLTDASGFAYYSFQAGCVPKYGVGYQRWKAVVSGSECYYDVSTEGQYYLTLLVTGDILLDFQRPDGLTNYTQEDDIFFLGATTDDCGDPLTATVAFFANHTTTSFECTPVSRVGANAYTCEWSTSIFTPMGWYNSTMRAIAPYYYENSTSKIGVPGLFYLHPRLKLENPAAFPTVEGWGYPNWNFSVIATSGDVENSWNVSLYMHTAWPPVFKCESPTCVNQTPTECFNCIQELKYWLRNFTASEQGVWYYQFKMDGRAETSQVLSVVVEKDDVNMSYVAGNNTVVIKDVQPQWLIVRIYDLDRGTYNVTNPSARVTFKLYNPNYPEGFKVIGENYTNEEGYASFYFNITNCEGWYEGDQLWAAEILPTEPNYKPVVSENYTITIQLLGCQPQVEIYKIYAPKETFQYRNFTINATLTSWVGNAQDVNATIILPEGWYVDEVTKSLGIIAVGEYKPVWWHITPTTYGEINVTIVVNSSNAGSDVASSDNFTVYKLKQPSPPLEQLPFIINENEEKVLNWECEAGDYRIANLTLTIGNVTASPYEIVLRVWSYNGTNWLDILHSLKINLTGEQNLSILMLQNQLNADENGRCKVRIANVGDNGFNLSWAELQAYYTEAIKIQDILVKVNEAILSGLEGSEEEFNVSVRIANSYEAPCSGTLWLNITNTSGAIFYSSSQPISLAGDSIAFFNFTGISTIGWEYGFYVLKTYVECGPSSSERTETLLLQDVVVESSGSRWMCNSTTEPYYVIVYHPFNESIQYNISLIVPTGWSYTPSYQLIEASTPGKYLVRFDLTSSNAQSETVAINATVQYMYPLGVTKSKNASFTIEEGSSLPILEVIRETPSVVASNLVFKSRLVIHNKGCGTTNGSTLVKEFVPIGWTPANPMILGNISGSSSVDLEENIITWELGKIAPNQYAILVYQIKSPPGLAQAGGVKYEVNFDNKLLEESENHTISTFNYTNESHLQFDLEVIQQEDYPWPEPRSAQLNKEYNYGLHITNIGDTLASGWNISMFIPPGCEVVQVYENGVWNQTSRKIIWSLSDLQAKNSTYLHFTLNCSVLGAHILTVQGIKDTTNYTTFIEDVQLYCSGNNSSRLVEYAFSKPENARYERLKEVDFFLRYDWYGQNVTIGQASLSFTDDENRSSLAWQNYGLGAESNEGWSNYTIYEEECWRYRKANRSLLLQVYVDATYGSNGNISLEKLAYTWQTGKVFIEQQPLFIKTKIYTYSPLLTNATLWINGVRAPPGSTAGWGEKFNFSVLVRDRFGRDVIVYAWHRPVGAAEYQLIGSKICSSCADWSEVDFSYDYQPTDIGSWEFKFNASNEDGTSELLGYVYNVERDDVEVTLLAPLPNEIVNRSKPFNFTLSIYDLDNESWASLLVFGQNYVEISKYGSAETFQRFYPDPAIDENGLAKIEMRNTSDRWCQSHFYLGPNYWRGGVLEATYYKGASTSSVSFLLYGDLFPTIILPNGSTNYTHGMEVALEGTVRDDCGNTITDATPIFQLQHSDYVIEVPASYNALRGSYYTTFIIPTTAPLGWYNVTMKVNKTYYWESSVKLENAFFLASIPRLEQPSVQPVEGSWELRPFNFSVYVSGEDNETITAYLWLRYGSGDWILENSTECSFCSNYLFLTWKNFTCSDIGSWSAKFNATSVTGFSNQTSLISFNVTKSPISILHLSGNGSVVNRSDSQPNSTVKLSVQIFDLVTGEYITAIPTSNVGFWIQRSGDTWVEEFESIEDTSYSLNFNPNCNYEVGVRRWKVNSSDPCYATNTTPELEVTIRGDLQGLIASPSGDANYTAGTSILLSGFVYDECSNPIANASVRFKLQHEDDIYYCPESGFTTNSSGNLYICNWDSTGKRGGWYNVSLEVMKEFYNSNFTTMENAFFLITPVELSNPSVSYPGDGSWGEPHNFSVVVNHYAPVYVCLLERTPTSDWNVTSCTYVENPTNTLVTFIREYSCEDYQASSFRYFAFNASQPGVPETYSNTSSLFHLLAKDDVLFFHILGNGGSVNRSGSNSISFLLYLHDADRNAPAYTLLGAAVKPEVWLSVHNGSTFLIYGSNIPNSSGYVNFSFDPTCNYEVGERNWYTYISADACYKDTSSPIYNVTIIGDLKPVVTFPDGVIYYRELELYIPIYGNLIDECESTYITGATISFNLTSLGFGDTFTCSPVEDLGNGTYNCTFNATTAPEGWYNVTMIGENVEYYNRGEGKKGYSFFIYQVWQPPILEGERVIFEEDGGWGEKFTFKVNVSDPNANTVNVSLWLSPDNLTWSYVSSQLCYDCGRVTELAFEYRGFTCNDIGTYYFKFNASDEYNSTDRGGIAFSISQADAEIRYVEFSSGNDSWVNRSEAVLLRVRIYDLDADRYVGEGVLGRIWVTTDGANFDEGLSNLTDSEGYLSIYFSPNCSYSVNTQLWKAGVTGDVCYKDVNSSTNFTLNIKGWARNSLLAPNGDVFWSNENVTIRGLVQDECGENISEVDVSFEVAHDSFLSICEPVGSESPGVFNCTWNISNNPSGWYWIRMNSSGLLYNFESKVFSQAFFHEVPPILAEALVTPSSSYWSTSFVFKVNVTDDDDHVTVYLWHRRKDTSSWTLIDSGSCDDCIHTTLSFSRVYGPSEIGEWEWFFNATDSFGGVSQTPIQSLTVTKMPVVIEYVSGNQSSVSRVGNNATLLSLRVRDVYGNPLSGLTGGFWITVDGVTEGPRIPATTSYGYLNLSFNPDCAYQVGWQTWKGGVDESPYYYGANSTDLLTLLINSSLVANVLSPQHAYYWRDQVIEILGNVSDDCSNITGATVRFRVIQGAASYTPYPDPAIDLLNGTYTTSWDSTGFSLGWYNISMNVSKPYYESTYFLLEDAFFLGAKPELQNPRVNPSREGWGRNFTFTVSFRDVEGDTNNLSLLVANSPGGPWKYVTSTIISSTTWSDVSFNHTFECNDYLSGSVYFKFIATDEHGFSTESSVGSLTLEKDDITIEVIAGAGAQARREGTVFTPFTVRVYDVDRASYVGEGVSLYFFFTYDGSNFDGGHYSFTNASGFSTYYFDPDCNYGVGTQFWKVSVSGNACYKDVESTIWSLLVIGQLKNNLESPPQGSTFNVTQNIIVRFNISTDCIDEGLIPDASSYSVTLIHNSSSQQYECSPVYNEGTGWYNCTWSSIGKPEGNYTVWLRSSRGYYDDNSTFYLNWFWLENRAPIAENETIWIFNHTEGEWRNLSNQIVGWSRVFNYTIEVRDEEGDDINCTLWISKDGGNTWMKAGSSYILGTPGYPTIGRCEVIYAGFTCSDMGESNYFMWEIDDGVQSFNTTPIRSPSLQRSNVTIEFVSPPDLTPVIRNFEQANLVVRVFDEENWSYPMGVMTTFWIRNRTGELNGFYNLTNASGFSSFSWIPGCQYSVGTLEWVAGVADNCYLNVNLTSPHTLNLLGNITIYFLTSSSRVLLRGDNLTIKFNLTSDCTEEVLNESTLSVQMLHKLSNTYFPCYPLYDEGDGTYNCTWNTSSLFAGWYDVEVNASRSNYLNASAIQPDSFFIETAPILSNISVSPEAAGYSARRYFNVTVVDEDNDTVTVYLWIKKEGESWSAPVDSKIVSGTAEGKVVNFSYDFSCGDVGNWNFKFTAEDDPNYPLLGGNKYSVESEVGNFFVGKNPVVIAHLSGNNSSINRVSGSENFAVQVLDGELFQPIVGAIVYLYLTTDGSTFNQVGFRFTNTSGMVSFPIDPDCTYQVGPQYWFVNVSESTCNYGGTSQTYTFYVISNLSATIIAPQSTPFRKGEENVTLIGRVMDDCGVVENAVVRFLAVGGSTKSCTSTLYAGNGYYNCTISASDTAGMAYGWYNLTMNASKPWYHNISYFLANSFFLASVPLLSSETVSPLIDGWGVEYTLSVSVTDLDENRVNTSAWLSRNSEGPWSYIGSGECIGCQYTPISFRKNFTCADQGTWYFKFNATDEFGYSATSLIRNFTVEKDDTQTLFIDYSPLEIGREGQNSVHILMRIKDYDRSRRFGEDIFVESGVSGSLWVTYDGANYTEGIVNFTNASGYLVYYFDPDCSFGVGQQYWIGGVWNDSCYKDS
ncbi:MAG: hypothetical protein OH337_00005, partial [Candidatus Parvarchaeota archaeon]|nr:hypothetical protein [Candidatus Haiyanarchaeum thermophilum]